MMVKLLQIGFINFSIAALKCLSILNVTGICYMVGIFG